MLPTPPQLDGDGNVIPHNHPEILAADELIRRVSQYLVVKDPKVAGGVRPSSRLLTMSTEVNGGMSIDLKRHMEEDGVDAAAYVSVPPWLGSVIFTAQDFRNENLMVGYHPVDENPYHGEVWGNLTDGCKKRLLRIFKWFVPVKIEDIP